MKKTLIVLLLSFSISVSALICEAHASEMSNDNKINLEQPYAFATAPNAKTGAAFMIVRNTSDKANSLIEARADVAEIVEIHQNLIDPDDGTMMMRKIKKIDMGPNDQAILEPTGYHVMLINLTQPLTKDKTFPLTLIFENGEEIKQDVMIVAPGTKPESNKHEHGHDHEHGDDHEHPADYEPFVEENQMDFSDTYLKAE